MTKKIIVALAISICALALVSCKTTAEKPKPINSSMPSSSIAVSVPTLKDKAVASEPTKTAPSTSTANSMPKETADSKPTVIEEKKTTVPVKTPTPEPPKVETPAPQPTPVTPPTPPVAPPVATTPPLVSDNGTPVHTSPVGDMSGLTDQEDLPDLS